MLRSREQRTATLALGLFVLASLAPGAISAEGCDASVEASLEYTDEEMGMTRHQFKVDVRTDAQCAKIHYDLIIEEITADGQTKRVRKPRVVKLNDSSLSELVIHKMPADHSMADYEARVVVCEPCEMFP